MRVRPVRPDGAQGGCDGCPFCGTRLGGGRLHCEHEDMWTNLLDPQFLGDCLVDLDWTIKERNARLNGEPVQLSLF